MPWIPKGRRGWGILAGGLLVIAALAAGVFALKQGRPHASVAPALPVPALHVPGLQSPALPVPPLKLRWSYRAPEAGPIEGGAVIAGDTVYIADTRGTLEAIDLAKGQPRWSVRIEDGFATTPLVLDGQVMLGDLAGVFHAFAADDGKPLWTYDTGAAINGSANASGNTVLFGNDDGSIFALDARTGKKLWTSHADDRINSAPAVTGGAAPAAYFTGCDGHLRKLAVKNGAELLNVNLEALCPGSPVVLSDRLIAATDGGRVVCYSADGTRELWAFTGVADQAMVYTTPAVGEGLVVVGARDQAVHAIDLATGKQRWSFATHDDVDSSPAICAGRVYFGSKDKQLYVLDLKTGKKLWEFNAGRPITASVAIGQGVLVVGDGHGTVYCFELGKKD